MQKMLLAGLAGVVLLIGGFFALNAYIYHAKQGDADLVPGTSRVIGHKDAEYVIDGQRIKLTDGLAEVEAAPGSASKIVTRYFGNELNIDLDNDGREDVVFLLTQETGGNGTFFYVVAALNTESGYVGSEAALIGDRIAPQTTELGRVLDNGTVVIVNYSDRASEEDLSKAPTVGKSVWLLFDPETMRFSDRGENFSGEAADTSEMSLAMKPWTWISASYNDGREIKPKKPGVFVLTFDKEGRFSLKTDCNSTGGTYIAKEGRITFADMMSTMMYCEGSQETEVAALLSNTSGYHFSPNEELILDLKFDSGTALFR